MAKTHVAAETNKVSTNRTEVRTACGKLSVFVGSFQTQGPELAEQGDEPTCARCAKAAARAELKQREKSFWNSLH